MTGMRCRRRYAVCTAVLLGAILIGCGYQPEETTEITISPGPEMVHTVATEPLVEATGDTIPTESVQATETPTTEPQVTEPPVTEPPTDPPTTEPPTTEPPVTESPATEPPTTDPPATEPPCTEPQVTEPPETVSEEQTEPATEPQPEQTMPPETEPITTEPTEVVTQISLDYSAAMAYGNQYAVDTYGYYIDLTLNADNAGFEFPYSASVSGIIEKGGQEYLHLRIARKVDSLVETLSARGVSKAYINCHIYKDADGVIHFYVYYG